MEEGNTLFGLVHLGQRLGVGRAGRGIVAMKTHITAERDRAQLPARAVAVVETEQFGPEADGEGVHLHAAAARDPEVAEFMKEHDDGQYEEEGQRVAEERAAEPPEVRQEIHAASFPEGNY